MKEEEQKQKQSILKKPWVQSVIAAVLIFGALGIFLYWQATKNTVKIENSVLSAPIINLSSTAPGTLNALYVKEGNSVAPNTAVALVGSQILTAVEGGVVTYAPETLGAYIAPGQTVVSVVNTSAMKVVGSVDETKGLKDIAPGERVTFTVDAFPGKKYDGIVDTVSPTSDDTGITFSISDKRPIKKFDITVRFDAAAHPEFKNGMSAKITVSTK